MDGKGICGARPSQNAGGRPPHARLEPGGQPTYAPTTMPTKIQRTRALLSRVALESANPSDYRQRADEVLQTAVGYDAASWGTVDPATMLPTSCQLFGIAGHDPERERTLFRFEAEGNDFLLHRDLAQGDLAGALGLATAGQPQASRRFRELMAPLGAIDELRIVLVAEGDCWGTVSAYRGPGRQPYTRADVALARAVAPVLGAGLRLSLLKVAAQASMEAEAPGWLLLDADDQLVGSTPAGERWLEELAPAGQLPAVLRSVATAVRVCTPQPRVEVPARSGGWLNVHGSRATGLDEGKVVLIIEPQHRPGIAPELCAAYSLTRREQDVLGAILRGASTKQIAAELDISEWTFRDHVRAIFAKVGVQSRQELAARIFEGHVWPRSSSGACPGPNGWFLDGAQLPEAR